MRPCLRCKLWDSAETHAETRARGTQKNLGVPAERDFHGNGPLGPCARLDRDVEALSAVSTMRLFKVNVLP